MANREFLERARKTALADGQLMEACFLGYRLDNDLGRLPPEILDAHRLAFFTGAYHIYAMLARAAMETAPDAMSSQRDFMLRELKLHQEMNRFLVGRVRATGRPPSGAAVASPQRKLGDARIEDRYRETMNSLARFVDGFLNGPVSETLPMRENGFVLLVFPLNDHEGRCNYVSNGRREDIVALLKEQLARLQGAPDVEGHA